MIFIDRVSTTKQERRGFMADFMRQEYMILSYQNYTTTAVVVAVASFPFF